MKVRQDRLLAMLIGHRFSCGPESLTTSALTFVRPSHSGQLFESIIVDSQGKHGEAVYACVGVAVTRSVMHKLLGEVQFLDELGEDSQRGWTIIEDDVKARRWEARLAEIAPVKATLWADARGPHLLQETAEARSAVDRYLTRLKPADNLEHTLTALRKANNGRLADEAERLSSYPIFVNGHDAMLAYRVACHLIVSHSEEIDGKSYFGQNPMNNTALLKRIEILVDKLSRAKWWSQGVPN